MSTSAASSLPPAFPGRAPWGTAAKLRAWQAAAGFDARHELGPWLATSARRVAIDLYRREASRATRPRDAVAPDDPALAIPPHADAVPDVWEVRRCLGAAGRAA